jgi:hypothetical protein
LLQQTEEFLHLFWANRYAESQGEADQPDEHQFLESPHGTTLLLCDFAALVQRAKTEVGGRGRVDGSR